MHVYRFRIIAEDHENFVREIEIKPAHTFEDFHQAILNSINVEKGEMASFYICDSRWHKLLEIGLLDMNSVEDEEEDEENKEPPMKLMAETTLKECINDPNQRIMYIYDFFKMHTFYIELHEIMDSDAKKKYPCCVKAVGDIQKPPSLIRKKEAELEADDDIDDETEAIFDEDSDMLDDEDSTMFNDIFDDTRRV